MSEIDIGDVYDDLQEAWETLLEPHGVKVFSGPPGQDETGEKFVHFGDAEQVIDQETSGDARDETWKVDGEIVITSVSWQGGTETGIRAARNQATSILNILRGHVAEEYADGSYPDVEFTGGALVQSFDKRGRQCGRRFELTITFPKNP